MLLGVATFAISLWALIESVRSIYGTATHFWSVVAQAQTQVRCGENLRFGQGQREVHGGRARTQRSCRASLHANAVESHGDNQCSLGSLKKGASMLGDLSQHSQRIGIWGRNSKLHMND